MHRIYPSNSTRIMLPEWSRSRYWRVLNLCLFFVLLAVCTWAVHYRLAQYEATQHTGTRVPAAKMWLAERNQMPVPSTKNVDLAIILFFNLAFASVLGMCDGRRVWASFRKDVPLYNYAKFRACLTHFFFLPPPARSVAR